jgi:hypothetical protein
LYSEANTTCLSIGDDVSKLAVKVLD